jgi:hypothetical protein
MQELKAPDNQRAYRLLAWLKATNMKRETNNMDAADDAFAQEAIAATQHWIEAAVIGLNLCPFAKAVYVKQQIRYVVSDARSLQELQADLVAELRNLQAADPEKIDTALLIHPWVLNDFLAYNDFLDIADASIDTLDLSGQIQIASFHPQYQFADSEPDDIENCTNRSPYPMLHLLREASIDRAVEAFPDAADIFNKNMETMRRLGHEGWQTLLAMPERKKN